MSTDRFDNSDRNRIQHQLHTFADHVRESHPFPFTVGDNDGYATLRSLAEPDLINRIDNMMGIDLLASMVDKNYQGYLEISAPEDYNVNCLLIKFGNTLHPAPFRKPMPMRSLSSEEEARLEAWLKGCAVIDDQIRITQQFVNQLTMYVNTPGQFKRVWPDGVPFLGESHQRRIQAAQKKSPVPQGLHIFDKDFIDQRIIATDTIAKGALMRSIGKKQEPVIWPTYMS